MFKQISRGIGIVLLAALSFLMMIPAAADATTTPCQSSLNGLETTFEINSGTVKYKVELPRPACEGLTFRGDLYVFGAGYDGSGEFNHSASPAMYVPPVRVDLTLRRGYRIAHLTPNHGLSCGWMMGVLTLPPKEAVKHYNEATPPGLPYEVGRQVKSLGPCA